MKSAPSTLDIAASRTGNQPFLHVLNLDCRKSFEASFAVVGRDITGGRVIEIAPPDLRAYVNEDQPNTFQPINKELTSSWRFPPASVSVVELALREEAQR